MNLDDGDEVYNWPWLYAVQVGEWGLTEAQAKKLRDYLLRGGFFMADDFHGSEEQAYFEKTMKMVFPERPIVDIPNNDPIFHTVFDLDDRYRITGAEHLATGYKKDGTVARWEGIYDDKGRVMVAISLNSDIGDSWEWSDTPQYPAEVFRPRHAHRRELRRLRDDPLRPMQLYRAHSSHYPMRLLQFALLLLKNHGYFCQNRYAHQQAAILRGTFSSILSGEGFDEVERGESPLVLCNPFRFCMLSLASLS